MSRSGYSGDLDHLELGRWRGRVASAIRGKRGQRFLRELRDALDALPEKRLVQSADGEIVNHEGDCCALGSVALAQGWEDACDLDSNEHEALAARLDVAWCLIPEIEYQNDEHWRCETPEERWSRVRAWVDRLIRPVAEGGAS